MQKYSCVKKQSRGKFRINSTKHADFRLKWCILKKNTKITLSGEVMHSNSIDESHIEGFLGVWKQLIYSETVEKP